jgi:hypothetical protein
MISQATLRSPSALALGVDHAFKQMHELWDDDIGCIPIGLDLRIVANPLCYRFEPHAVIVLNPQSTHCFQLAAPSVSGSSFKATLGM